MFSRHQYAIIFVLSRGDTTMENNSSDKKPTKPSKKKKTRKIWRNLWIVFQVFIVLGIMGFLFTGGVAAGFFASNVQDDPLRSYEEIYSNIYDFNETGEAYFQNEEFIGYLRTAEVSQPITVNEVSPYLIEAILATEDSSFHDHNGVNFKAITRAVIEQFTNASEGSGGSTITQQLVKNQILNPERSFKRKFKEMLLAMRIERMFNKTEILEAYMNIVYMGYNVNGSNIEGVKAAAEGIFGIDVLDLNISQSAYIAGMIHSPGRYTPFNRNGEINDQRLERGLERMSFVLGRMLETGRITQAEHDKALTFDIRSSLTKPTPGIVEKYPFLTFEIERRAIDILVNQRLEEQEIDQETLSEDEYNEYLDFARRQLSHGGYKVHTTIDRELYEAFHEITSNDELFGPRSTEHTYVTTNEETGEETEIGYLEQTAATLLNNQTGAIIAMVEGRDFNELQYNLNTEPRQPGSSIKPLLDYAPALELGLVQPASVIDDVPIFKWDISTNDYWIPRNYNGKYHGLLTARTALNKSYNIPAIKTFLRVQEIAGKEVPFDYLRKMGITTLVKKDLSASSVAIGGMTYGLTVEENTNAFATFANNGSYVESYLIEKIETLDGKTVYQHEMEPTYVFSEQTAFLMNDMLRTVVNQGTATRIRRGMGPDIEIAGKTGTTNDSKDSWFVGYTPKVSMGVWIGYDKGETLKGDYGPRNQNLWILLMQKVQELRPELVNAEDRFNMPSDIVRRTVCSKSGMLPSKLCTEAGYLVEDYFNRKYLPTETDDSLVKERMVIIDGERFIAQELTPDDFVSEDVYIKREPLEIPEKYESKRERYLPLDWDDTAPQEVDPREENGKVPDQPSGLKVAKLENGIELTWHAVDDLDIAGYRVYRSTKDGQFVQISSVPNHLPKAYTDETVQEGEIYAYHVIAVDIAGQESKPSKAAISNQVDPDLFFAPELEEPSPPNGLNGSRSVFGVELNWDANPEDEEVDHYQIYYSADPVNGFRVLGQAFSTYYTHTFIDPPENYWYYVTAVNKTGESKESAAIRITFGQSSSDEGGTQQNDSEDTSGNGSPSDEESSTEPPPSDEQNNSDEDEDNVIGDLP
jgi:penicillin-binding protein